MLRYFLTLLIALSLPIAGWANTAVIATPCPMMAGGMAGMQASAGKASCCVDLATMAKTGSPCKTGQECQTTNLAQPVVQVTFTPVFNAPPLVPHQLEAPASADPGGFWRPPRIV